MEGDEEKMGTAAHLMVQNLAGSLALVTCKEPLRISMVTHIRNLLLQNGFSEGNIPEQAILIVAADNLELACAVVEKVAMDKAVLEVDDGLAPAYLARRTHREVRHNLFPFSNRRTELVDACDSDREKPSGIRLRWLRLITLECSPIRFDSSWVDYNLLSFKSTKISPAFELCRFKPVRFILVAK